MNASDRKQTTLFVRRQPQRELWTAAFTRHEALNACDVVSRFPGYAPTPLLELPELAADIGVNEILYKDESNRFAGSFKALGATYAIFRVVENTLATRKVHAGQDAILSGALNASLAGLHLCSATAGNFGKAVAWTARHFSIPCRVFVHAGVPQKHMDAMRSCGAEVCVVDGDYDCSVHLAAEDAEKLGSHFISDTMIDGYLEAPRWVMTGYSLLVHELLAVGAHLSHVVLPAGVGGLAAGFVSALVTLGASMPKIIVAEPIEAACLAESARDGCMRKAGGSLDTLVVSLACATPSAAAWSVLARAVDGYVAVDDTSVLEALRKLRSAPQLSGRQVGSCAGLGLACLITALRTDGVAESLQLDKESRVLILGTDGG